MGCEEEEKKSKQRNVTKSIDVLTMAWLRNLVNRHCSFRRTMLSNAKAFSVLGKDCGIIVEGELDTHLCGDRFD